MTPRKSFCRNCHQPIFRALSGFRGWVHVSPRYYFCYVQQAVGYRPVAEPQELEVLYWSKDSHPGLPAEMTPATAEQLAGMDITRDASGVITGIRLKKTSSPEEPALPDGKSKGGAA